VEPAIDYLEAYRSAVSDGDLDRLFPFLDEDVTWWSGDPNGRLRSGVGDTLGLLVDRAPAPLTPGPVFLAVFGPPEEPGFLFNWVSVGEPVSIVRVIVWQGAVVQHVVSTPANEGGSASIDGLERRYEQLAEVLSSGDPNAVMEIVSDRTVWVREEEGGDLSPVRLQDAFFAAFDATFAAIPDNEVVPLTMTELGLGDSDAPAVFARAAGAEPRFGEFFGGGVGIYRMSPVPEATFLATLSWLEDDSGLIELELLVEPIAAEVSWTGESTPTAGDPGLWPVVPTQGREQTGVLSLGGSEVELYNASDAQRALVAWAIDRFEAAGIPPPRPGSVAFPPDYRCALYSGLAVDTGAGVDLQLCFDDAEACAGDSCSPTVSARSTLLHELGHVWTVEHLDETARESFLGERGLTVWSEPGVDRDQLGTEHAAEILAWGLMDEGTWAARLPNGDCDVLRAAFIVLTGVEPLRACDA
jgi:hypothetical protein